MPNGAVVRFDPRMSFVDDHAGGNADIEGRDEKGE